MASNARASRIQNLRKYNQYILSQQSLFSAFWRKENKDLTYILLISEVNTPQNILFLWFFRALYSLEQFHHHHYVFFIIFVWLADWSPNIKHCVVNLGIRFVKKADVLLGFFHGLISDLKLEIVTGCTQFMVSGGFLSKVLVGEICLCSHSVVLCLERRRRKKTPGIYGACSILWTFCIKTKTSQCVTQNFCPQEGSLCLRIKSIATYSIYNFLIPLCYQHVV